MESQGIFNTAYQIVENEITLIEVVKQNITTGVGIQTFIDDLNVVIRKKIEKEICKITGIEDSYNKVNSNISWYWSGMFTDQQIKRTITKLEKEGFLKKERGSVNQIKKGNYIISILK